MELDLFVFTIWLSKEITQMLKFLSQILFKRNCLYKFIIIPLCFARNVQPYGYVCNLIEYSREGISI